MNWLIIALVGVPTTVALYYMMKANRKPENKEVVIKFEIDERLRDESTSATQTERESKLASQSGSGSLFSSDMEYYS